MNYHLLLDITTELGYQLAMCGAETFRIEETIDRIFRTYGISSEAFAIPNNLTISIETPDGTCLTRMRRIGYHGNDLDSVERYNSLSRRICEAKPSPEEALKWLKETTDSRVTYGLPVYYLGNFLGGFGFAIMFGGTLLDSIWSGLCGVGIGFINRVMSKLHVNTFFSTIASALVMALMAYGFGILDLARSSDVVIIGALMLLVPGLIFTNAMRDIIFGDTNSGINRIVQVLMIATAIALGTGTARNLLNSIWGIPQSADGLLHSFWIQLIASGIGCLGFVILFNIRFPGGFLCMLGGMIAWGTYLITLELSANGTVAYFVSAVIAAAYSEIMARVRRYPAISYLVVSIFPLIPGAGIYYTSTYVALNDAAGFVAKGTETIATAGAIAIGILSVSTLVRLSTEWKKLKTTDTKSFGS